VGRHFRHRSLRCRHNWQQLRAGTSCMTPAMARSTRPS
jgi:hypothetical protein